jgi:hypothetical protein
LNPKNNIVDVTNYVLHDLDNLYAFDAAKNKWEKYKNTTIWYQVYYSG